MTDTNSLIVGAMLAFVGPILLTLLGRLIRRSQITYLPISILVAVCIGSMLFGTAFLTKSLIGFIGSPFLSFIVIAIVQSVLMALSVRYASQGTAVLEGAMGQVAIPGTTAKATVVEQDGISNGGKANPATTDEAIASELLGAGASGPQYKVLAQ